MSTFWLATHVLNPNRHPVTVSLPPAKSVDEHIREKQRERVEELAKKLRDVTTVNCPLCFTSTNRCCTCLGHICQYNHVVIRSHLSTPCGKHVSVEAFFYPELPKEEKEEKKSFIKRLFGKSSYQKLPKDEEYTDIRSIKAD